MKSKSGFTLVELLITIVVIAILASISIVAYNGIQSRAKQTRLLAEISAIKNAMEIYKADKGDYPYCPPGSPSGGAKCNYLANILPLLQSTGISNLPSSYDFPYVHSPTAGWTDKWAMMQYGNLVH